MTREIPDSNASERLRRHLVGGAARLERVLVRMSDGRTLRSATLHRFHRELRGLAVAYQVWCRANRTASPDERRRRLERIRRLARLAGEVRDRDVGSRLLARLEKGSPSAALRQDLQNLRRSLRWEGKVGREVLLAQAAAERRAGLLREIHPAPSAGRSVGPRAVFRAIRKERRKRGRDAVVALRRARKRVTPGRLHRLRQDLRAGRLLRELNARLKPDRAGSFPRSLVRLQARLGRLHDVEVLLDRLEKSPEGRSASALRRSLGRDHRHLAKRIAAELERPSVGRALRRLRAG